MAQPMDLQAMLAKLNQPAFFVKDGAITACNRAAAQRMLEPGMAMCDLLLSDPEDYASFTQGCLYLSVCVAGSCYRCTVTKLQDQELFVIENADTDNELQVLALAAKQLRIPLSEITLELGRLSDNDKITKLIHQVYKLQRLIGNMSDAAEMSRAKPRMLLEEICGIFEETLEKAKTYLAHSGITLQYKLPQQPIFTLADRHMLARAIYNLLSNAAKFSDAECLIDAALSRSGNRILFTVCTKPSALSSIELSTMFHRYKREPGLEDPRFGMGLGMTMIHTAATAHGGTVLVEQPDDVLRVTFTMAVKTSHDGTVRSPILLPDIYGGMDQALIELSDVLPTELYKNL
ncbi:MAG: HAMP domain-containing histidine kinase [Oscillospiraceae bacterium]|nr:HAMP domain-containing histidine kinase [Oscillospiraceae bacterium]